MKTCFTCGGFYVLGQYKEHTKSTQHQGALRDKEALMQEWKPRL